MVVSLGRDQFLEAMRVRQNLDKASGSQAQIIARAETARHRLQTEELQSAQLVKDAGALAQASAKRLAQLNTLAEQTSVQLTTAQNALEQALAARAQAARERAAAQARAARARATAAEAARTRTTYSGGGGAACTGKSTAGQANGNLDPGSLCPLWRAPGHRLRADAAKAFNAMSQYHARTVGSPLCVTDSYRSYSEQVSVYHRKPGLAAVPGTSNHGWGLAVDFCGGIQSSGSSAYRWMEANAGRFGFIHPDWAKPSGSKPEAWHWEFNG
jgi:LAS superfamily LD-carboxypeptidase LdcB